MMLNSVFFLIIWAEGVIYVSPRKPIKVISKWMQTHVCVLLYSAASLGRCLIPFLLLNGSGVLSPRNPNMVIKMGTDSSVRTNACFIVLPHQDDAYIL